MMNVDIIILSNCLDEDIYNMNQKCISSLIESENKHKFNIFIIESNKSFNKKYHHTGANLEIIIPDEPFNYNRFLNIGLQKSTSDLICFSNNDLIFQPNWFSEILNASNNNNNILSFCPINIKSKWTPLSEYEKKSYYLGYRIRREFVGWCYVFKKEIFDTIIQFDEKFSFYFQDDDLALTLQKYNISHALVPKSKIIHLGGKTSSKISTFNYKTRVVEDRKVFHNKWGSQRSIAFKNMISRLFRILRLGYLSRFIY